MYNYSSFNILLYDFELKSHKNILATSLALDGKVQTLAPRLHVVSILPVQSEFKNWYVFKEKSCIPWIFFQKQYKVELNSKIALTNRNGLSYDWPTSITNRGYFFVLLIFFI